MATWRLCEHLRVAPENRDYRQFFTGEGRHYDLACAECCQGEPHWVTVSEKEFRETEKKSYWDGIAGQPEVQCTPSGQMFLHNVVRLSGVDSSTIKNVVPLTDTWLLVTTAATLLELGLATQATRSVCVALEKWLDFTLHLSARVSSDESLVAIYRDARA